MPSGTSADFEAWIGPHLTVLAALAVGQVGRDAAADLVQDTLVRAWLRHDTFRPDRGSPRAWLIGVLFDQARRRRTRAKPPPALGPAISGRDVAGEVAARVAVGEAVRALSERQREAIELFYLADLPVSDVARLMGITEGAVKAHLHQARERLRPLLEDR